MIKENELIELLKNLHIDLDTKYNYYDTEIVVKLKYQTEDGRMILLTENSISLPE